VAWAGSEQVFAALAPCVAGRWPSPEVLLSHLCNLEF